MRKARRPAVEALEGRALLAADLAVTLAATPEPVRVGQELTYTITATNKGPDTATGVVLTDMPPTGAAIPMMPALSQGTFAPGPGGTILANFGTLAPGATATMTLVAVLTTSIPGPIPNTFVAVNTASVRADQADPDPSNNTANWITSLPPPPPVPLRVVSLRRFGFHAQPTLLTLAFSTAVFTPTASDPSNYVVTAPGRDGRLGTNDDQVVPIRSATVDGASGDVTLALGRRLSLSRTYRLRVNAAPPNGLTDMFGHPLDGDDDGQPGGDYVAQIDRSLLAGRADQAPGVGASARSRSTPTHPTAPHGPATLIARRSRH